MRRDAIIASHEENTPMQFFLTDTFIRLFADRRRNHGVSRGEWVYTVCLPLGETIIAYLRKNEHNDAIYTA